MFSTRSGYFCSAYASKTISERLRILNSAPHCSPPSLTSFVAETQGFEPWRAFRPCLVSSEVLSTTQPRLHIHCNVAFHGRISSPTVFSGKIISQIILPTQPRLQWRLYYCNLAYFSNSKRTCSNPSRAPRIESLHKDR
jgi:hypothetical protein